jgi:hypothetical protein
LSPILVRPVREQLEHDRVIRLLQAKYKRKFDVAINPGHEQTAPVGAGPSPWYPDLVLHSTERSRRLVGVVEVETAESVNNLEAMSQWVAFSKQRADFHLYVPATSIDVTRRLCADHTIEVTEIWAYHTVGEQIRFVLVQRAPGAVDRSAVKPAPKVAARAPAKVAVPKTPANGPVKVVAKPVVKAPPAREVREVAPKARAVKPPVAPKRPTTNGRAPARPTAKAPAKKAAPAAKAGKPAKRR